MEKKITGRGQRYWGDDCHLQQVQCSCGEIFEAWIVKDAEEKFDKHECNPDKITQTNPKQTEG
jgi:hypothetical protein